MANPCPNIPLLIYIILLMTISYSTCILGTRRPCTDSLPNDIQSFASKLRNDPDAITTASNDYGNLVHETPSAVLYPSSVDDIVNLIKFSNNCSTPFGVSARGRGHSIRGQAMAPDGVVVEMTALSKHGTIGVRVSRNPSLGYYADVGGEQLWIDVLRATMEHGLAPASWTDYLYLTVGGTLSNGGISGQSFLHGPQISNVLELDVITGKGELMTCSKHMNTELFFGVLGGLGQFGIITRARIVLHEAPTRAKWVRLIYSDFSKFTRDQEHLISTTINGVPNYVEGSLITHHSPPNNWRSSFYSPSHQLKIASLLENSEHGLLYSIEFAKYYDDQSVDTVDEEPEALVKDLKFNPGFVFERDVSLFDFLSRVKTSTTGDKDNNEYCSSSSEADEAHPWLNLFVPKSRIHDFNAGVFVNIIARHNHMISSGPILFYPFNRTRWDDRMSAVTPNEEIFYTLGLLHSTSTSKFRPHELESVDKLNKEIIDFCEKAGIEIKLYLPHYKSNEDWAKHFGPKWTTFQERKTKFDPLMILSPGQRIFTSAATASTSTSTLHSGI